MMTNNYNDTSERSGCWRKRTAGHIPMHDLTSHTHGGNNWVLRYQEEKFWNKSNCYIY